MLDLTTANNFAVRAGPIPPTGTDPVGEHAYSVHLYIDRNIIEVIVNNATALVALGAPGERGRVARGRADTWRCR